MFYAENWTRVDVRRSAGLWLCHSSRLRQTLRLVSYSQRPRPPLFAQTTLHLVGRCLEVVLTGEVYSGHDGVIPGDCKLHEGCPEFTVIFKKLWHLISCCDALRSTSSNCLVFASQNNRNILKNQIPDVLKGNLLQGSVSTHHCSLTLLQCGRLHEDALCQTQVWCLWF